MTDGAGRTKPPGAPEAPGRGRRVGLGPQGTNPAARRKPVGLPPDLQPSDVRPEVSADAPTVAGEERPTEIAPRLPVPAVEISAPPPLIPALPREEVRKPPAIQLAEVSPALDRLAAEPVHLEPPTTLGGTGLTPEVKLAIDLAAKRSSFLRKDGALRKTWGQVAMMALSAVGTGSAVAGLPLIGFSLRVFNGAVGFGGGDMSPIGKLVIGGGAGAFGVFGLAIGLGALAYTIYKSVTLSRADTALDRIAAEPQAPVTALLRYVNEVGKGKLPASFVQALEGRQRQARDAADSVKQGLERLQTGKKEPGAVPPGFGFQGGIIEEDASVGGFLEEAGEPARGPHENRGPETRDRRTAPGAGEWGPPAPSTPPAEGAQRREGAGEFRPPAPDWLPAPGKPAAETPLEKDGDPIAAPPSTRPASKNRRAAALAAAKQKLNEGGEGGPENKGNPSETGLPRALSERQTALDAYRETVARINDAIAIVETPDATSDALRAARAVIETSDAEQPAAERRLIETSDAAINAVLAELETIDLKSDAGRQRASARLTQLLGGTEARPGLLYEVEGEPENPGEEAPLTFFYSVNPSPALQRFANRLLVEVRAAIFAGAVAEGASASPILRELKELAYALGGYCENTLEDSEEAIRISSVLAAYEEVGQRRRRLGELRTNAIRNPQTFDATLEASLSSINADVNALTVALPQLEGEEAPIRNLGPSIFMSVIHSLALARPETLEANRTAVADLVATTLNAIERANGHTVLERLRTDTGKDSALMFEAIAENTVLVDILRTAIPESLIHEQGQALIELDGALDAARARISEKAKQPIALRNHNLAEQEIVLISEVRLPDTTSSQFGEDYDAPVFAPSTYAEVLALAVSEGRVDTLPEVGTDLRRYDVAQLEERRLALVEEQDKLAAERNQLRTREDIQREIDRVRGQIQAMRASAGAKTAIFAAGDSPAEMQAGVEAEIAPLRAQIDTLQRELTTLSDLAGQQEAVEGEIKRTETAQARVIQAAVDDARTRNSADLQQALKEFQARAAAQDDVAEDDVVAEDLTFDRRPFRFGPIEARVRADFAAVREAATQAHDQKIEADYLDELEVAENARREEAEGYYYAEGRVQRARAAVRLSAGDLTVMAAGADRLLAQSDAARQQSRDTLDARIKADAGIRQAVLERVTGSVEAVGTNPLEAFTKAYAESKAYQLEIEAFAAEAPFRGDAENPYPELSVGLLTTLVDTLDQQGLPASQRENVTAAIFFVRRHRERLNEVISTLPAGSERVNLAIHAIRLADRYKLTLRSTSEEILGVPWPSSWQPTDFSGAEARLETEEDQNTDA